MLAAVSPHLFVLPDDAATGVGTVDLIIEIIAVAEHQEREIAAELAVYLPAEEHHGIRLARTLRVPEDAELAPGVAPRLNGMDRTVHAQILLVLSDDLDQPFASVVE